MVVEDDARPYPVPTTRAVAPRFGGSSLFYLSSRGTVDGLWRLDGGQASEVWKGTTAALTEPPAVSADGRHVAVVTTKEGKRQLAILAADGTGVRTLAASIDIQGAAGQSSADWSPDGKWIAAGGADAQGPGLFKIPVDSGPPVRLVAGTATNPIWSPEGDLILYGGPLVAGQVPLLGVRADGTAVTLPPLSVRAGGYRFLSNGKGVVYMPRRQSVDFWLFDLAAKSTRQLTRFGESALVATFDVTPDGRHIVFDRSRENSDIVLIELPD
jgi:Tol biopolymer transport system component